MILQRIRVFSLLILCQHSTGYLGTEGELQISSAVINPVTRFHIVGVDVGKPPNPAAGNHLEV